METMRFNVKSCSSVGVNNGCVDRGQTSSIYKNGDKFFVRRNNETVDGDEQFIAWNDEFISFKPRQKNEIYTTQSVMTVEQMQQLCDGLNVEKPTKTKKEKMEKTNNVAYALAEYRFIEALSKDTSVKFLTYNELMVYRAIVKAQVASGEDSIHASVVVNGDHAIAGTISTLNMKGIVRCKVRSKRGYISAVTTKNYNEFNKQ